MSVVTWGLLEKSQVDNETIEEAIDRLILAHNEDESAHLEEGQSLQSHKASEVIDHVVASVVADKLANLSVEVRTLNFDKFYFHHQFEVLDGWDVGGDGGFDAGIGEGKMYVSDTADSLEYATILLSPTLEFIKNPIIQFLLVVPYDYNQEIYFGGGAVDATYGCFFGFKIVDDALFACHSKDTNEYTTDISSGIDVTDRHIYKVVYTYQSKIEFYVDGVLKATHNTNLPDSANQMLANRAVNVRLETTADEEKELRLNDLFFTKDL